MSKAAELAALIANVNKGSSLANKNFVQNGSFQVWQRATAATAQTDGAYKTADRWFGWVSGGGAYTTEQSTGNLADTGHENALKVAVTTADTSIASGDYYAITHRIEAQNLQSLQYGSANAKPVTLSFWVKATKTGINTLSLTKDDSTAIRMVKEYTINSSDTWEYKTMTFVPDSSIKTAASAIVDDNGRGFQLNWVLKYGSTYNGTADAWTTSSHFTTSNGVNNMDSTSNTFYITGVQLEIGEKATEFEHESYEATLRKCHRYFVKINDDFTGSNAYHAWSSIRWGTNQQFATIALPQPIRGQATISITGTTGVTFKCDGSSDGKTAVVHLNTEKSGHVSFYGNSLSFDPANSKAGTMFINDDSSIQFDAEI